MMTAVVFLVRWSTILAAGLLFAGFLGPWAGPADSLAQFRHILIVAVTAGACAAAALTLKRVAVLGLAAAVAALALSVPHLPFMGPPVEGDGTYKLIQFNVKIHNTREAEAAQWIIAEKPDVLMLQEVLDETHPGFVFLDTVLPYRTQCKSAGFGEVAVRTRFPVVAHYCGAGDGLAWAQVNVGGTLVTFASLHLKWPWPGGQWEQIERLRPVFEAMPQPIVLGGDHNAVPWSRTVKTVERLTKSHVIAGYRTTFWPDVLHNGRPWPALPIDHVLLPEGWTAKRVDVGPNLGSDHRPVIVEFDP